MAKEQYQTGLTLTRSDDGSITVESVTPGSYAEMLAEVNGHPVDLTNAEILFCQVVGFAPYNLARSENFPDIQGYCQYVASKAPDISVNVTFECSEVRNLHLPPGTSLQLTFSINYHAVKSHETEPTKNLPTGLNFYHDSIGDTRVKIQPGTYVADLLETSGYKENAYHKARIVRILRDNRDNIVYEYKQGGVGIGLGVTDRLCGKMKGKKSVTLVLQLRPDLNPHLGKDRQCDIAIAFESLRAYVKKQELQAEQRARKEAEERKRSNPVSLAPSASPYPSNGEQPPPYSEGVLPSAPPMPEGWVPALPITIPLPAAEASFDSSYVSPYGSPHGSPYGSPHASRRPHPPISLGFVFGARNTQGGFSSDAAGEVAVVRYSQEVIGDYRQGVFKALHGKPIAYISVIDEGGVRVDHAIPVGQEGILKAVSLLSTINPGQVLLVWSAAPAPGLDCVFIAEINYGKLLESELPRSRSNSSERDLQASSVGCAPPTLMSQSTGGKALLSRSTGYSFEYNIRDGVIVVKQAPEENPDHVGYDFVAIEVFDPQASGYVDQGILDRDPSRVSDVTRLAGSVCREKPVKLTLSDDAGNLVIVMLEYDRIQPKSELYLT